jgi:hypothetical protein
MVGRVKDSLEPKLYAGLQKPLPLFNDRSKIYQEADRHYLTDAPIMPVAKSSSSRLGPIKSITDYAKVKPNQTISKETRHSTIEITSNLS